MCSGLPDFGISLQSQITSKPQKEFVLIDKREECWDLNRDVVIHFRVERP